MPFPIQNPDYNTTQSVGVIVCRLLLFLLLRGAITINKIKYIQQVAELKLQRWRMGSVWEKLVHT
jgi:hypothetical protein